MRKYLKAAKWKMNKTPGESIEFLQDLHRKLTNQEKGEILICPPYTSLYAMTQYTDNFNVHIGAQDVHWENDGAYTGKISCRMLKELNCEYVIIGHSEQRTYFYETDETVNKKVMKVLEYKMTTIICVGETLQERELKKEKEVVTNQLKKGLQNLKADQEIVIAYEPVWAIGTGKNATPEQAQEMHKLIRELLHDMFNKEFAEKTRIIYGGSLKPENAKEIFSQPDIDGGLIGGASLKVDSYYSILKSVDEL